MAELDANRSSLSRSEPRKLMIDHLLDRVPAANSPAERSARMREIARFLLDYAIEHAQ